jgi:hypothetical protein
MHTMKHEYTCNQCGFVEESTYRLGNWRSWTVGPEVTRDDNKQWHYDFCSEHCLNEWLKEHNFEVKE